MGRVYRSAGLYRLEAGLLLALLAALEVRLTQEVLAAVVTVAPSFPPLSEMAAPINNYLWPEVLRLTAFMGGTMLVFAAIKRMTAK